MPIVSATTLKSKIGKILRKQGYRVNSSDFKLKDTTRESKRYVHNLAKAERIIKREDFIVRTSSLVKKYLINGKELEVKKIQPKILEVKSGSEEENLFRWWNLTWWSLPYERGYGRQMRFIIWDTYHNSLIGLIGLQSPILSWSVRDNYLNIPTETLDYWVNQSLSAQRLGALPPYNSILGGKLVASLMTTDTIRMKFKQKYSNKKTVIKKRNLPAQLLFITTTGAYGKSSIYNRLKFKEESVAKFIGYTKGSGSFHIPNPVYEDLLIFLERKGNDIARGCGSGPSRKLRFINQALKLLGFEDGAIHGVERAVYLFPLVKNLENIIHKGARIKYIHRNTDSITTFWKERWSLPRAEKDKTYLEFVSDNYIEQTLSDIENYKKVCKSL